MADKRAIDLEFPLGGLDRRWSYQRQPPYTSPDMSNVWPDSAGQGRRRGGSRSGFGRAYGTQLGGGTAPVRMLAPCQVVSSEGYRFWEDSFSGASIGDTWTAQTWNSSSGSPSVADGYAYASYGDGSKALLHDGSISTSAASNITAGSEYHVGLFIVPYQAAHWGTYRIYVRAATSGSPNPLTEGVVISHTMTGSGGTNTTTVTSYSGGTPTAVGSVTNANLGYPPAGWLTVIIGNGSADKIGIRWAGRTILALTTALPTAHTGLRFGWGFEPTVAGGRVQVDSFRIQYIEANYRSVRSVMLASAGGTIYKQDHFNEMETYGSVNLSSTNQIQAVNRLQKLYVADWDAPVHDLQIGQIVNAAPLSWLSWSGYATTGIDAHEHMVEIYGASAIAPDTIDENDYIGTYEINSVQPTYLELNYDLPTTADTAPPGSGGGVAYVHFRVVRCPKSIDPVHDSIGTQVWRANIGSGFIPLGCRLIALYRDRLVLAGDPNAPHVWYMARQGDPFDWDYGQPEDDFRRAYAGTSTGGRAGMIGQPITALIAHTDDYLLFGCPSSIEVLRGDPAVNGSIDVLSRSIGIISGTSWCRGPNGETIFLSRDGLYAIAPGALSYPESLSRERLPRELIDLDPQNYVISMVYDARNRGIHIFASPVDKARTRHWMMDWEGRGFFPMDTSAANDPMAVAVQNSECPFESGPVWGTRDGYIMHFSRNYDRDDSTAISSRVLIGPFRAGDGYRDGFVDEVIGELATGSSNVTWSVLRAADMQGATEASAFATGTFSAGFNYTGRPRARGNAWVLKLAGSQNYPWSMERVTATMSRLAKQRKA